MAQGVAFEELSRNIKQRLKAEFGGNVSESEKAYNVAKWGNGELKRFVVDNNLNDAEITILLLALVPHHLPDYFTGIMSEFLPKGGEFPDFGGVKGKNHRGILPTGETVLFILAGKDLKKRTALLRIFDADHLFAQKNVLAVEAVPAGEPKMSGRVIMDEEYVDLFTTGKITRPKHKIT